MQIETARENLKMIGELLFPQGNLEDLLRDQGFSAVVATISSEYHSGVAELLREAAKVLEYPQYGEKGRED